MSVELTPELDALLNLVTTRFKDAERRQEANLHQNWNRLYRLYRSYKDFKTSVEQASPRDKDGVVRDGELRFGQPMFIPYAFYVVETILPRMLATRPHMSPKPIGQAGEEHVEKAKYLMDAQQARIDFELKLQDTAKSGLIYGLGVQKSYWDKRTSKRRRLVPLTVPTETEKFQYEETDIVLADDPNVEDVDIFDFFWDPVGWSIETCGWVVHRTWRSTEYCLQKFRSGEWANPGLIDFETEVPESGSTTRRSEIMAERERAMRDDQDQPNEATQHEIWEYHDTTDVIVVVDGAIIANQGENHERMLPFQIYRPTTAGAHKLQGIGEIEPIEDLQYEMNALRRSRRDNAALVAQQVFAYMEGVVDPGDIQLFPGAGIPVNGDPRELLMPIKFGEIPQSGYQEEQGIGADIERVSGVSDALAGAGPSSGTATEAQLGFGAANVRIAQKTRRVEVELVKPTCAHWWEMNTQRIMDRAVRMPQMPDMRDPNARYTWVQLTPQEMEPYDWQPEGNSTTPDNVPQDRADAQALAAFRGDPAVDQKALYTALFRKMGERQPELFLAPEQRVPPVMLDLLVNKYGMDQELLQEAFQEALQLEEQQNAPNAGNAAPSGPPQNGAGPDGGGGGDDGSGPVEEIQIQRDENKRITGATKRKKANASSG